MYSHVRMAVASKTINLLRYASIGRESFPDVDREYCQECCIHRDRHIKCGAQRTLSSLSLFGNPPDDTHFRVLSLFTHMKGELKIGDWSHKRAVSAVFACIMNPHSYLHSLFPRPLLHICSIPSRSTLKLSFQGSKSSQLFSPPLHN